MRRTAKMKETSCPSTRAATGTGEWAATNVNVQTGCEHACKYCYASCMAIRFKRATPDSWAVPVINQAKVTKRYAQREGRIMFPTTHDITPGNIDACVIALRNMLKAGNDVLVVSKPHLECIQRLCRDRAHFKDQITFRFSIGSTDDLVLKLWEPGAPAFSERLECLQHAFEHGFQTSVSCEPMLDEHPHKLVAACRPFVSDAIWLGRANRLMATIAINCPGDLDARRRGRAMVTLHSNDWVRGIYSSLRHDSLIKWKDSIKEIVGLERPTEKGLDV